MRFIDEHDTVTPVFWAVTVSASDRCKSDIKLRFIEEPDTVSDRILVTYGIGIRTKSDIEKLHSIEEKRKNRSLADCPPNELRQMHVLSAYFFTFSIQSRKRFEKIDEYAIFFDY